MSGSASLAAAKRRRSKFDQTNSRQTNSRQTPSNQNTVQQQVPQQLNVQQSFQYMWQKIQALELKIENNSNNLQNVNSNTPNTSNIPNRDLLGVQQKINSLERSFQLLSKSVNESKQNLNTNKSEDVNEEAKFVSVDQFNTVMNKIAEDMQGLSQKTAQLTDYVSAVQNNNIILRTSLEELTNDSLQSEAIGLTVINEDDLSVNSSGSSTNGVEDSIDNNSEVDSVEDREELVEEGKSTENNATTEDNATSAILGKLKTLNSDDIKNEVAQEFNNITLTVSDVSDNGDEGQKTVDNAEA